MIKNIDEAIEQFRSKGLFAETSTLGWSKGGIRIAGKVSDGGLGIQALHEIVDIYPQGSNWIVEVRNGVPYYKCGDFEIEVSTLADAFDIAHNWYFGKPEVIAGWLIETHRHPEWRVEKLRECGLNAPHITATEWAKIDEKLEKEMRAFTSSDRMLWFAHPELVYWKIAVREKSGESLWVARDLSGAYIVDMH